MRPSGARTAVGPIQVRAVASHRGRHRLICGGRSRAGVARPDGLRAKAPSSATTPLTDLLRWRRHGWAIDTLVSQPAAGLANPCDLKRRTCVESRIDTFTLAFGKLFLRSTRPASDHRVHGERGGDDWQGSDDGTRALAACRRPVCLHRPVSDAVKMKRPSSPTPASKGRFAATSLE